MKLFFFCFCSLCYFHFNTYLAQDTISKNDKFCCECYSIDTTEIKKIIYYKAILSSLDPSYLMKMLSLSENIEINIFEKRFYMLSLDKQLKFQTNKILYYLDGSNDSASLELQQVLTSFVTSLRSKIQNLNQFTLKCKEEEIIIKYLKKQTLMNLIDPSYKSQFITLTSVINENDLLDYKAIIKFEEQFNKKIEYQLNNKNSKLKLSSNEKENLQLLEELFQESTFRIQKFKEEKINADKVPKIISKERLEQIKAKFILKEIIRNGDTIFFDKSKMELIKSFQTTVNINSTDSTNLIARDTLMTIETNNKLNCVDLVPDLFISLQVGVFSSIFSHDQINLDNNLYFKKTNEGKIIFSFGKIISKQSLEIAKKQLKDGGITEFKLVAYKGGEFYPVEKAIEELLK